MDPPAPPPGQPLLSDNDNKFLEGFFDNMEDNFPATSFGEGLNFSDEWLNLPPQFMGHTTSYGQQPATTLQSPIQNLPQMHGGFPDMMHPASSSMMPPPPPPPPPHPHTPIDHHASADVLVAATLLQNGSMPRPNTNNHDGLYAGRNTLPPSMGPPVGHLRHQPLNEFRQADRRMSRTQRPDEYDNTFTDMMFGSTSRPAVPRAPTIDVQWGTDANFGRHNSFVPHSEKETTEAILNEHLSYMGCLEVNTSAATTRPSSPAHDGVTSPLRLKTRVSLVKEEDETDVPPRKRRKSKAKDDAEDDDDEQSASTSSGAKSAAKRRKSKPDGASLSPPASSDGATTGGKRRKSAGVSAPKQPRENLSDAQKRSNHIKSEQKRRTVIKEGFDDLCELVPGLGGGGFSKSTMLTMSAEWLEEVLHGNQVLQKQLDALMGR